ncbi:MAG: glutamine synthetase III [Planctomycetota bacterium]
MTSSERRQAIQSICNRAQSTIPAETTNIEEIFGSLVFDDRVMRAKLPKAVYNSLRKTIDKGQPLDLTIADVVAVAMRDWAVELGATHYTHWFQPMTGSTAEKHDSFITPQGGKTVLAFSGSELIQGEPDASSFPSGGIRATFEARGYTAWDPSSPVFIRESRSGRTLCIPTAFYSYTGESLDKKTPLLRSMDAISKQAVRLLHTIGYNDVTRVVSTVGAEQEYFLVDKNFYYLRPDLVATGRTLFGARPSKGQELEDHYFGSIKPRILAFMRHVERELYKLGIPVKTRHNEVAPAQYELACIYEVANLASDHNMLVMEILRDVADQHDLVCLLHEKPFAGINGSGKHNNWSMADDLGNNLLDPGETPHENAKFLVFLAAVIRAVDVHNDLLRASVAQPGNDHRLGANEAPPAIISAFLGDQLTAVVEHLTGGKKMAGAGNQSLNIGVNTLPALPRHNTDRNRTSPFAFTGNKFEFRAVGSSQSITIPNTIINTIAADSFEHMAKEIEAAAKKDKGDLNAAIHKVVSKTLKDHKRVIFNGDNYTKEWQKEAENRGLKNLRTTVDALGVYNDSETTSLFERHNVMSRRESEARSLIHHEIFSKKINIEGKTLLNLGLTRILPAALGHQKRLADTISSTAALDAKIGQKAAKGMLGDVVEKINSLKDALDALRKTLDTAAETHDHFEQASVYGKKVLPQMAATREVIDSLETIVDDDLWPFPKYEEILYVL